VLDNVDDTIAKIGTLKTKGVRFSVDDFGTGYSSLAYLTRLPLDQLKIDQSFVHNLGVRHTDDVIVQTILGMARNLELDVIAEGVETEAQKKLLAQYGCTFQGYLMGRPVPVAELEALLEPVTTTAEDLDLPS
jgi:EAL domain-containing protein (putative c-di-GMP-specific phosphodiesterase class I)